VLVGTVIVLEAVVLLVDGGWRILCSAVWFAASSASGNIRRSLVRCADSVVVSAQVVAILV
jgi:hypothetical protein